MTAVRNDTFLRLPFIKRHAAVHIDLANQYFQAKLVPRMLHFRSFPGPVLSPLVPQSGHFVFLMETRILCPLQNEQMPVFSKVSPLM